MAGEEEPWAESDIDHCQSQFLRPPGNIPQLPNPRVMGTMLIFPPLLTDALEPNVAGTDPPVAAEGLEHSTTLAGDLRPLFS